jgi:hypothetical protein
MDRNFRLEAERTGEGLSGSDVDLSAGVVA